MTNLQPILNHNDRARTLLSKYKDLKEKPLPAAIKANYNRQLQLNFFPHENDIQSHQIIRLLSFIHYGISGLWRR